MKRPPADGDEQDAFTGWRHVMFWQRGELRKIKRRASKRERRAAKAAIERGLGSER
jgi:hypothetical protein